jgi:hypothetical protein
MQREEYAGDQLRTDGYYYHMRSRIETQTRDETASVLIFLKNGFFSSSSFLSVELDSIDKGVSQYMTPPSVGQGIGYFHVTGDSLNVEFWTNAARFPVPTALVTGEILTDTSISLGIFGRSKNDIWRFRPLAVKPDSTTLFEP